ncbi:MAG: MBL fold metallo-hydrolase [Sandaracinaceae bacterium]|nr:MBL fold metallo-hydrolase [Sandaracinaceae bacterium]
MLFRQLFDATSSTYTYLLASRGEAVLVDTVYEQHARDAALIRELDLTLVHTLDTHVHADHVTGAWRMKQAFGSRIGLAASVEADGVDTPLADGTRVAFGERALLVRATPGHTSGCLTFVLDDESMAFTGDCLLIRGAGRTDFQEGDAHALYRSIREVIFALPESSVLYPGHDYSGRTATTVGEERRHNPRVGGAANETDFVGYMDNLGLPHPKQIDIAVPANMKCGRPEAEVPAPPAWGPVVWSYASVPEIEAEWVSAHLDEVHVLDVRQPSERGDPELGAIEGSQALPLGELTARVAEVPRDKPVVAVCRSGRRSAQATVILRRHGFERVANLTGGMIRWREQSPLAETGIGCGSRGERE